MCRFLVVTFYVPFGLKEIVVSLIQQCALIVQQVKTTGNLNSLEHSDTNSPRTSTCLFPRVSTILEFLDHLRQCNQYNRMQKEWNDDITIMT